MDPAHLYRRPEGVGGKGTHRVVVTDGADPQVLLQDRFVAALFALGSPPDLAGDGEVGGGIVRANPNGVEAELRFFLRIFLLLTETYTEQYEFRKL